jgi:predicted PurR-regulated permease PerM/methanogenic corrinoid protein MtbC1
LATPSTILFTGDGGSEESIEPRGAAQPIVAIIVATAVLYFARNVLIPLAAASLLAVVFSPIATRLERFVGLFASSLLVVVTAVTAIAGLGYFLTSQIASVAGQVTEYTDNISAKITALRGSAPEWLKRIEDVVAEVQRQIEKPGRKPKVPTPAPVVQASATESGLEGVIRPTLPLISAISETFFIVILFFFLLYGRKELRDRVVRLMARVRVTLSAEGIATAAAAVSHYLLLFFLTNVGYGLTIGIAMWLFGLPNPALWGTLAALLRFIPYIGVPIAALLPSFVALAEFPGWSKALQVLGTFVATDQIVGYFIEPFLIGRGIGLSPLALVVSAMFWSWLWGVPGLLLATSLTACLKVAGDYVPALGFFSVLLGADGTLEDCDDYYRSLLELDVTAAQKIAISYCDKNGLERTFDNVLIPAIDLAGEERSESHISQENQQLIIETTVALIKELGDRLSIPHSAARLRILGVCAPGEVHRLGLQMLLELMRRGGVAANFLADGKSLEELRDFIKRYSPDLVLLSCSTIECASAAEELVRALKTDSPRLTIICGGNAALAKDSELLSAGAFQVCESRSDLRRTVRRFALRRSLSPSARQGHQNSRLKSPSTYTAIGSGATPTEARRKSEKST